MSLRKKPLENIVERGENPGNQPFLYFPECFLPYQRKIAMLKLLSTNAFNLDKSRMLLFGKQLKSITKYNAFRLVHV